MHPGAGGLAALVLTFATAMSGADARYDRYRQPERVVAALGLEPGQRVADVGASTGYLTFRLADAVGRGGQVVATDIDDGALAALRARAAASPNVVVRKVAPDQPGLEPDRYDLIVLAFVDQYLPDRADYLSRLRPALRKGGRLAVLNRLVFRDRVVEAAARTGYAVASETRDLPGQFLILLTPQGPR